MIDTSFGGLHVTVSNDGAVVRLTFDHGKANEMGSARLRELEHLGASIRSDPDVRVLITDSSKRSSRGTPIFVAGADVTERVGWSNERVMEHVRWQRSVLAEFGSLPVFHIVVVSGVALGWGTEFMLTADYRIGARGARFALPETGLGILPGAGGTSELWRHIGVAQALRLGMTGEQVDVEEACRIGLVQEWFEDEADATARADALAARVVTRSPTANAAFKRGVYGAAGLPRAAREALEADAYDLCVRHGEAAIGRENFASIRRGETPPWGPRSRDV